jgi:hypothetical protein
MCEKRILLLGGVSLVKGRVKEAGVAMREICDDLEPLLREEDFVERAPFETVSLIIRFGERESLDPVYDRIDRRHNELPVSIEMKLDSLRLANKEAVKGIFLDAVIKVLLDVAKQYDLPKERLLSIGL